MSALLAPPPAESQEPSNRAYRVEDLVDVFGQAFDSTVGSISEVNLATKILALNAMVEAARAGEQGASFHVIAQEMKALASKTDAIAADASKRTKADAERVADEIGLHLRGTRLCDLARMNVDLIDRNLYERTCDVRWWATDSSVVQALTTKDPKALRYASHRLGVILNAYTVYLDLVLCGLDGRIVANGRPDKYASRGANVSRAPWFQAAMATASGDEYGFQSAHRSELVDRAPALIYSAAVRERGRADGRILGALGVVFNWSGLSQPILSNTPIEESEKSRTELYIVDPDQTILASFPCSREGESAGLDRDIVARGDRAIFAKGTPKGYLRTTFRGKESLLAYAAAPGFETYSTGWYALIVQALE